MQTELIPFGKYKGQPIEQLQQDPGYVQWLMAQPWFSERYRDIHTVIINNFKEPADTPEHNALQSRFLDKRFAISVAVAVNSMVSFDVWCQKELVPFREKYSKWRDWTEFAVEFEVRGWDVMVKFGYHVSEDTPCGLYWGGRSFIEAKPTIGEDFPSVLRQVKSRIGKSVSGVGIGVVVESFVAESVKFEDVQSMFASSHINLLRLGEIPMMELPPCFVE